MSARNTLPRGAESSFPSEPESGVRGREATNAPTLVDGRYRLVDRLGSGGMGIVYRADDVWLGRQVALKVMHASSTHDELRLESFKKEARMLARVRHDNVVQVYTFGPNGASFYLAMEYIAGKNLDELMEEHLAGRGLVPLDRALSIVRDVGRGLAAVHAIGVVHRDVKPSNIVIEDKAGKPVLVDFGLARRRTSTPELAITGGTPFYMAPEQITDARGTNTTAQSDLYALACTAYELLTGRPVFEGADDFDVLRSHLATTPPKISSRRRELAPLDDLFARALAKEPEERQAGCDAFVQELEIAARKLSARLVKREGATRVLRVALLETDDGLAKHIARIAEREMQNAGDDAEIERAPDLASLEWAIAGADAPHLVILDAEGAGEDVEAGISRIVASSKASATGPDIVLLRRSFYIGGSRAEADGRVTELPKPVNARVLGAVVAKLGARRLKNA